MFGLSQPPDLLVVALAAGAAGLVLGLAIEWALGRAGRRRLEAERLALETQLKNEQALKAEREAAFELASSRLAGAFGELANRSLKSNSETFLRLAEQNLGAQHERARRELAEREQAVENLVKPIREALKQTESQIGELEKARRQAYGSIRAQLETMQQSQQALQLETRNLVKALRRPEVRGQWGEITLRRLAEMAGMVEHCDFVEQAHTGGPEGAIRPDMIVRMPDERELVVDVKTPLDAYLEAVEAPDDVARKAALARHARKLRERIGELAKKSYWSQFPKSPEFVILFIPGDQFLTAALNEQPDLLDEALRQKIILATPTSFVALLKAVAYGWRQLALAENAEEIRHRGEQLYDRLAAFSAHLARLGKQLTGSVNAYNAAVGSLERSVLPGARRFVELGVQARREMEAPEPVEALTRRVQPQDEASDRSGAAVTAASGEEEAPAGDRDDVPAPPQARDASSPEMPDDAAAPSAGAPPTGSNEGSGETESPEKAGKDRENAAGGDRKRPAAG